MLPLIYDLIFKENLPSDRKRFVVYNLKSLGPGCWTWFLVVKYKQEMMLNPVSSKT
jgi:hypothetical protein